MSITKTKTRNIGDIILTGEVSPCVWMYKGHHFQIQVHMGDQKNLHSGGNIIIHDKALNNDTYTEMDIVRMLAMVRIQKCKNPGCHKKAFHPDHESNRQGECEHCFMTKLQVRVDAEQKKEDAKIARRDKQMKRKGMVVRVEAWVHPDEGDDYMVDIYYSSRPAAAEIETVLRDKGSAVLNDYRVVAL